MSSNEVVVFPLSGVEVELSIDPVNETVWATQSDIEHIFGIARSNVSRHLRNVFESGELDEKSNLRKTQIANSDRPVALYSLDAILAVGYRANTSRASEFRRWANGVLKQYLLKGVAVNERRVAELEQIVKILERSSDQAVAGAAEIVHNYLPALRELRDYDQGSVSLGSGTVPQWTLNYDEARAVVDSVRAEFPDDTMFGGERGDALKAVVETIYQGFAGEEIYPTVQLKAANLLYLTVKDHPLTDGNKRSAAALFVHFLAKNEALVGRDDVPLISNNALAAVTLLVAMSQPHEKELMIALISRMLSGDGEQ